MANTNYGFSVPGSPPPLAQPSFTTGPNDQLAVQSAYTASGGIINAIKDDISSLGISIPDILKGGKALASLLPIVTGIKNGSLLTSPVNLVSRLLASSTQITSAFKLLGPDMQNELLSGLKEIGPVAVTVAGLTQSVKVTDFNNLVSVGNLINSFTNGAANFGLVDKDGIASVIGGIVKQAGGFGITGVYGAIMTGITDAEVVSKAAGISLPTIISTGDAKSLTQMAQMLSPGAITLLNPSALSSFSSMYQRLGANGTIGTNAPMSDSSSFANIMGAFNASDSAWNVCSRSGSSTQDISTLTGLSGDMSSMISNAVKTMPAQSSDQNYALASLYGVQDVDSALASSFPNVLNTTNSSSSLTTGTTSAQSTSLLDKLASYLPSFSSSSSSSNQQATDTDAYYAQQRALLAQTTITSGGQDVTTPLQTTSTAAVTNVGSGSSAASVPTVTDVYGNQVPVTSHTLLGYTQTGVAVYADDPYQTNAPLFATPS